MFEKGVGLPGSYIFYTCVVRDFANIYIYIYIYRMRQQMCLRKELVCPAIIFFILVLLEILLV